MLIILRIFGIPTAYLVPPTQYERGRPRVASSDIVQYHRRWRNHWRLEATTKTLGLGLALAHVHIVFSVLYICHVHIVFSVLYIYLSTVGGAKYPSIFGVGVPTILRGSQDIWNGCARYPGVPNIL